MKADGWINAGEFWHDRIKNVYVSNQWLWDVAFKNEVHYFRKDDNFPFKVETVLKEREIVPQDAYLVAWFFEVHKHGFILRFMHKSFPEVPSGQMIPEVEV